MKVKLINGTEEPEKQVCRAARNDYRKDGIIGNSFSEIMKDVDPHEDHVSNLENSDEYSGGRHIEIEAKKRTLLDHLITSGHWGPFEHPQATVALEGVTRVLMAQITRHRHFTFDVMSLRYVGIEENSITDDEIEDSFDIPDVVKDGEAVDRQGVHDIDILAESQFVEAYKDCMNHYRSLIDQNVPQEVARKVLPMGTKVNIVMSGNARAWMHILNVRTKANVQGETRECADKIFNELKEWMPYTFEQYDEDVLPLKLNP